MVWIVSAEIAGSRAERKARLQYIKDVTGDKTVSWEKHRLGNREFYRCVSNDEINGVFVTAHNDIVFALSTLPGIANKDFIVANTCIWIKDLDKRMLQIMREINSTAQLFYAKQTLEFLNGVKMVYSNSINDMGTFGFLTSKSERILYRNRKKGLMEAICSAFDLVTIEEIKDGKD